MRPPLLINGVAVDERSRPRLEHPVAPAKSRIFDHMNGEPEDVRFSKVAHAMRRAELWKSIPARDEPTEVSGEIA